MVSIVIMPAQHTLPRNPGSKHKAIKKLHKEHGWNLAPFDLLLALLLDSFRRFLWSRFGLGTGRLVHLGCGVRAKVRVWG